MYPTPPKALSATRAHRKEKGEGGKEKGNDAPPTRWPPEDFFGIPPPPPLFLSPSFLLCTTHPLPSSQDKTTHTTREQRKGKGKDERKRGKDEGPTRRRPPKELFWTPPTSLSLSLYLCTPHPPPSSQDKTTHPRRLFLCFDPTKEQKKYEQPSPAILSEELFGPFFVISPAFLATTRPPR